LTGGPERSTNQGILEQLGEQGEPAKLGSAGRSGALAAAQSLRRGLEAATDNWVNKVSRQSAARQAAAARWRPHKACAAAWKRRLTA